MVVARAVRGQVVVVGAQEYWFQTSLYSNRFGRSGHFKN
jgi:hypothetical protein